MGHRGQDHADSQASPTAASRGGSYTNKTVIAGLGHHTTLIGWIRRDAKLHFPHAQSPRWYGPQAPTPEQLRKDEQYPCLRQGARARYRQPAYLICADPDLPVPKWQQGCARHRVTTQRLVQQLRQEVWGHAIDQIATPNGWDDFVTLRAPDTKSPEWILAPLPPLAYARSG